MKRQSQPFRRRRRRPSVCSIAIALFGFYLTFGTPLHAHNLEFTYTILVLGDAGRFELEVTCDLDALALGLSQGTDSAQVASRIQALPKNELDARIERLRLELAERIEIWFDGRRVPAVPEFPEHGVRGKGLPTVLGLTARFAGERPEGTARVSIRVDRNLPPVYLTVLEAGSGRDWQEVLPRGARSTPFNMSSPSQKAHGTRVAQARQYFVLGVTHIVPDGLDHVLFVIGLFLLSPRLRPLLWQVTTFTAAHTLTLAVATSGLITVPVGLVEPLIAFSIAYVAVENTLTEKLSGWRPLVVFLFGLLHGMGFARALGALELRGVPLVISLATFNLGVEAGQLVVLLGAAATIGMLRNRPWYRARVSVPLSAVIASVGLYWFFERLGLA